MKKFKNLSLPGGEKLLFWNNGSERGLIGHIMIDVFKLNIIDWQRKIAND